MITGWLALSGTACAASTAAEDASSTSAEGNATGTGESGGSCAEARPAFPEPYSSCAGAGHCGASDNRCASPTGLDPVSNPAFCTFNCTADFECPTTECSAQTVCIIPNNGGTGLCALDCSDGKQCPEGMVCLEDMNGNELNYLCF